MTKPRAPRRQTPTKPALGITDIVAEAEALQAGGDIQEAIRAYRQWLQSTSSSESWAAHFNLGVLLRDTGDLAGAQEAFQTVLRQKPDFAQAQAALEQVSPVSDAGGAAAAMSNMPANSRFFERDIYFVVCSPAYKRTSGGIHALHCLAEDMHAMGCTVGMLAAGSMPSARVPLITPERLQEIRSSGVLIVAIYPEIVVENILQADYVVWWLLNYPGFIKQNWDGTHDWTDRIIGFGPEVTKDCRCDGVLIYPLYDPDFFFPNPAVEKTETIYYVNRILGAAPDSRPPIAPTRILSPADQLSYKELRSLFWKTRVIVTHEWSGTFVIAQLCGVPVIFLESPLFSPATHVGEVFRHGSAWGYSEHNVRKAADSLGAVAKIHRDRKAAWLANLAQEIGIWIDQAKRKP